MELSFGNSHNTEVQQLAPSRYNSSNTFESTFSGSTGFRGPNGAKPHAQEATQGLIRYIVGDDTERISKASCYRAIKMYESERAQLEKVTIKLERAKKQRDEMAILLRRLTEELKVAKKERKEAAKLAQVQQKDIVTHIAKTEELEEVIEFLEEEVRVVQSKLAKGAGDTFDQILRVKKVEMVAKDARCDQQAEESRELRVVLEELEARNLELENGLVEATEVDRLNILNIAELELALHTCDAELTASEERFKLSAIELESMEESLAQAHEVTDELDHELSACQEQLEEREAQMNEVLLELEESRTQGQTLVVKGVSDGPIEIPEEAVGPLLRETEEKLKNSEESVVELRNELAQTNSALDEKDRKLQLLEGFMLEYTLEANGVETSIGEKRAVAQAAELIVQLEESQRQNRELTEQLESMKNELEAVKRLKDEEDKTTLEEKNTRGLPAEPAATASRRYFNINRDDLTLRLTKGFHNVMNSSMSGLSISNSIHGKSPEDKKTERVGGGRDGLYEDAVAFVLGQEVGSLTGADEGGSLTGVAECSTGTDEDKSSSREASVTVEVVRTNAEVEVDDPVEKDVSFLQEEVAAISVSLDGEAARNEKTAIVVSDDESMDEDVIEEEYSEEEMLEDVVLDENEVLLHEAESKMREKIEGTRLITDDKRVAV